MTDTQLAPQKKSHTPRPSPAILGIGTASPPPVPQADAITLAQNFSCKTDTQRAWLKRVFTNSGVQTRGSILVAKDANVLDSLHDFYPPPTSPTDRGPTTATRMTRYAQEAPRLIHAAACQAIAHANAQIENRKSKIENRITHLITCSCTGFFAPGLDIELINRLNLRPSVNRLHIGFMGCHAAFNALAAAKNITLANPAALVLVASVELSTLHFAYGFDPQKLVANALFADGSSAAIVGNTSHLPSLTPPIPHSPFTILDSASLLLPDSKNAMTWIIGDHGFEMTLSSELPTLIASNLRPWVESLLRKNHLTLQDLHHFAIHPGGPRILNAIQKSLNLPDPALQPSYDILAQHGNMSSATLLFLLQHLAAKNLTGPTLALGFGPGLMAEALLLEPTIP